MKYVDIISIRSLINSGKFAVKLDSFNNILLEDVLAGESIKIMTLPKGYCYRPSGKWEPQFIYTSHSINHPMEGYEGWSCSECGWTTDEKRDYCVCGADMRESRKINKELQELLDAI